MNAAAPKELFLEFLREIEARGVTLTLSPDGRIEINPASRLSHEEINRLKDLRPTVEAYLKPPRRYNRLSRTAKTMLPARIWS